MHARRIRFFSLTLKDYSCKITFPYSLYSHTSQFSNQIKRAFYIPYLPLSNYYIYYIHTHQQLALTLTQNNAKKKRNKKIRKKETNIFTILSTPSTPTSLLLPLKLIFFLIFLSTNLPRRRSLPHTSRRMRPKPKPRSRQR